MANLFAITTPSEDIKADKSGRASAIFTVTNTTSKPVRGIARARAMGDTKEDWLAIDGETERDFGPRGTQQFTVNFFKPVSAPTGAGGDKTAPEKFPFRVDVASSANPDEVFTEGPQVKVEVAPPPKPEEKKPFPWWIVIVIGAVLALVIIIILVIALTRKPADGGNNNLPTPTPTPRSVVEVINFYDRAPIAVWRSSNSEVLPFNGSDGDPRGFVKFRDGSNMENGAPGQKVLQTHPAWYNNGTVYGTYRLDSPIRAGDKFRATIGFLQGAGAGNLKLRVLLNGNSVGEIPKQYNGALQEWMIDLTPYQGQGGDIALVAWANPTSAQGWICWINPRIMND